jgi:hypothetical protein
MGGQNHRDKTYSEGERSMIPRVAVLVMILSSHDSVWVEH